MKNSFFITTIAALILGCTVPGKPVLPSDNVAKYVQHKADSMVIVAGLLTQRIEQYDMPESQRLFLQLRSLYKNTEGLVEYHFPGLAKALNGPALDKVEEGDDKIIEATGFQVVEELIFPSLDSMNVEEAKVQSKVLRASLIRLRQLAQSNVFVDANIFEALRLQLLRIMSLGLSGFDSPVCFNSIEEARASLEGIRTMMNYYPVQGADLHHLNIQLGRCIEYLRVYKDFDKFDRATFYSDFLDPLAVRMFNFQRALAIPDNKWLSALDMAKSSFFEKDIFNMNYFSRPATDKISARPLEELGKTLFFDPVLSGNNERSCASCHNPAKAFADGLATSLTFDFKGKLVRNTPSLINSVYQKNQFWDGRVAYIEDQIAQVMTSPVEMHSSLEHAANKLAMSDEYEKMFRDVFPGSDGSSVTSQHIKSALASYIKTLTGLNARFDQYMRGDKEKLSSDELAGFNLFMGKAKCGTCHFMPLFNGSVPPMYSETESEVLGVPAVKSRLVADDDRGKFDVNPHPLHDRMFRTPGVRNAALTAPYMHNGVFSTLMEVMEFYNDGGGAGLGFTLSNQTLPPDPLGLDKIEMTQIVSFIHSLTDTSGLNSPPSRLPSFGNSVMDKRKIGGTY